MNRQKAIAYAQNYLSFLFRKAESKHINTIYLFGSAARDELEKESDVDLFIDCSEQDTQKLERLAKAALQSFHKSMDVNKWRVLDFNKQISIAVGTFSRWPLKQSISAEAVVLYSKNLCHTTHLRSALFTLEFPRNKSKYMRLTRKLFGREDTGDPGTLAKTNGQRIGKNTFIVPQQEQTSMKRWLDKERIAYEIREIAEY